MKLLKQFSRFILLIAVVFYITACGGDAGDDTEKDINAISVVDYGAKGDGTTDDTEAFKSAFNTEATILIPDGTYLITSALMIPSTLHVITGSGTIKGTNPDGILKVDSTSKGISKLDIKGITFQFEPTKDILYGALQLNDASISNLTIQNCHFIAPPKAKWGNAITLVGKKEVGKKNPRINNIKIINNTFTDITRAAIEVLVRGKDTTKSTEFPEWPAVNFDDTIVTNLTITGNTFNHSKTTYITKKKAIFNPAISLSGAVNNTLIEGNTINNYYWGIELDGSTKTKVSNNIISTKHSSISISHGADTKSNSTVIDGNTLTSIQENDIFVVNAHDARSITLTNNTITGLVYLRQTDNFILKNNKLYSQLFTNIVIENATNTLITKNYLENTNENSNGSVRGQGTSDSSNKVTDNEIYVKTGRNIPNFDGASIDVDNNTILTSPK